MPRGQLFINGIDTYAEWGVSIDDKALSALMAPAPAKEMPAASSRLEHGTRMLREAPRRVGERSLTLTLNLTARTERRFLDRYSAFVEFMQEQSVLTLRTSFQPGIYYRLTYQSCPQFAQYRRGMALLALKVTEPNPRNRGAVDIYSEND